MTVLEKIKRCVSLVWDFQEFYGEEDIEDFCDNELYTYTQYNEIVEYFKHLAELEKENERLTDELKTLRESIKDYGTGCYENGLRNGKRKLEEQLTKAKEIIKDLCGMVRELNKPNVQLTNVDYSLSEAEQFLKGVEK